MHRAALSQVWWSHHTHKRYEFYCCDVALCTAVDAQFSLLPLLGPLPCCVKKKAYLLTLALLLSFSMLSVIKLLHRLLCNCCIEKLFIWCLLPRWGGRGHHLWCSQFLSSPCTTSFVVEELLLTIVEGQYDVVAFLASENNEHYLSLLGACKFCYCSPLVLCKK